MKTLDNSLIISYTDLHRVALEVTNYSPSLMRQFGELTRDMSPNTLTILALTDEQLKKLIGYHACYLTTKLPDTSWVFPDQKDSKEGDFPFPALIVAEKHIPLLTSLNCKTFKDNEGNLLLPLYEEVVDEMFDLMVELVNTHVLDIDASYADKGITRH